MTVQRHRGENYCPHCGQFIPGGFVCRTNDWPSPETARCVCGRCVTAAEARQWEQDAEFDENGCAYEQREES